MTSNNSKSTIKNDEVIAHSRRNFVKSAGAALAVLSFPMGLSFSAEAKSKNSPKIVWVLLRGALDSLHTVVPTFDSEYALHRPKLSTSFKKPLLPIDNGFKLNPALVNMHQWYKEKSMLPIVAVSSGYQQRSHFDGQDYLESGKSHIDHDSGWLARAINIKQKKAVAIARTTPISLRSGGDVNSWYPSKLKDASDDIYLSLQKLYQYDEALKEKLNSGLEVKGLVDTKSGVKGKRQGQFIDLSKSCAKLMQGKDGVDCAMLELGGWDTHNNQAGRLDQKLTELDTGLAELKIGLGDDWHNTIVIVGTEFGRTVKENGTGGTDHGTGSAMFLAGGAVAGGKVLGAWPGLKAEQLFEQRDLQPTSSSFSWIATVLAQHWQFTEQEILHVFPDIKPYEYNVTS